MQASIPAAETVWRAGPAPLKQRSCGAAAVPPAGPPSSLAAAHGSEGQHSEQASLAGGEAAACSALTCCQAPSAPPGGHQLAVGAATVTLPENNGPWDEAARLASLHELRVLGRPPDARFNSIVRCGAGGGWWWYCAPVCRARQSWCRRVLAYGRRGHCFSSFNDLHLLEVVRPAPAVYNFAPATPGPPLLPPNSSPSTHKLRARAHTHTPPTTTGWSSPSLGCRWR